MTVASRALSDTTDLATPRQPRQFHTVFVWGMWLAMSVWGVMYIVHYGRNVPHWDDWAIVPAYAGETPITLEWLWSQHNEHRILLPRAVMLGLLNATGDTRSGMFFNAALLSALSAVGVWSLAHVRGSHEAGDAMIPLLLLHLGQHETLIWMFALQNALFAGLAAYLLFAITRHREPHRNLSLVPFGAALLGLPLCGGAGIALGPFVALWLLLLSVTMFRSGDVRGRWRAALAVGIALALFALVSVYFHGYVRPAYHPPAKSLRGVLLVTTRFLASGFGGGTPYWPDTGFAAIAATVFSLWLLARTLLTRREETQRALGLTLFLAGCGAIAFAVGWGRSGMSSGVGFESRYLVYSVLFVCSVYAIWTVCYELPERRRLLSTAVMLLVCLTSARSYYAAKAHGRSLRTLWSAYESDARAGVALDDLAARHNLFPDRNYLRGGLATLEGIRHGAMAERHASDGPPPTRSLGRTARAWHEVSMSQPGMDYLSHLMFAFYLTLLALAWWRQRIANSLRAATFLTSATAT